MTNVLVCEATPKEFDAVNTAIFVPAVVGVPVTTPFVAKERPAGRLVAPNVIGAVPLAVTVLLNATPTVPLKELGEVKTGGMFVLGIVLNQLKELLRCSLWESIEIKL